MKILAVIFCGCIILMTFNLNVNNEFDYKFHNLETKRPFHTASGKWNVAFTVIRCEK